MGVQEVMNFVLSEAPKRTIAATEKMGVQEVMNFVRSEAPKRTIAATEMGVQGVMNFVVEKLKEALLAVENFGGEAVAWFNNVLPPETRGDKINHWFHVALPFLIAAVVLTVLFCFCRCCCKCCCGGGTRMMKAPGRNCRMPRAQFEGNPKGYFRNLRAHPGDQLC